MSNSKPLTANNMMKISWNKETYWHMKHTTWQVPWLKLPFGATIVFRIHFRDTLLTGLLESSITSLYTYVDRLISINSIVSRKRTSDQSTEVYNISYIYNIQRKFTENTPTNFFAPFSIKRNIYFHNLESFSKRFRPINVITLKNENK